jgi:hypothetical protein
LPYLIMPPSKLVDLSMSIFFNTNALSHQNNVIV